MLRSLSVPNILCAFDRLFDVPDDDLIEALSLSLFAGTCLRPGRGNENLEVRPIVSDSLKPPRAAFLQQKGSHFLTATKPGVCLALVVVRPATVRLSIKFVSEAL